MDLSFNLRIFCRQLHNNVYIFTMLILTGLVLPGISEAAEAEIDNGATIKINVINFIYITDSGLESPIDPAQEIERAVIFPMIEKTFRDFGVSNYSLKYEAVSSGNMDYSAYASANEIQNGLNIWGMVNPFNWPESYDLILIYYNDSQPVYRAGLSVRQGMITSWNKQKCQLPVASLGVLSGILALKNNSLNNRSKSQYDPVQVETYIGTMDYILPADINEFLLDEESQLRDDDISQKGVLTLLLESGGTVNLDVDQSYQLDLESFLTTNRKMNWILDQGRLLMPEIKFGGKATDEVATRDVFRAPEAVRYVQRSINIGILPFENRSEEDETDWLGFGVEYLLTSKFSNIPVFRLIDQKAVVRFVQSDSAVADVDGVPVSLDYSIGGAYTLNEDILEIDISIGHAFSGVRIASDHKQTDYNDLFEVVDNVAEKFIRLTDVYLTSTEAERFAGRATSSMNAFKNFCMGYIENARGTPDMDAVVRYFKAACSEDPSFWGAHYNLGTAYYNLKMYEEAQSQFDYIIKSFPQFELAYLGRGLTQLHNRSYYNAQVDFDIYKEKRPFDYRGWYYAGRCAFQMGQFSQAVEYFSQVIDLQPMFSRGYYEMGNVYYATNRFRPAVLNYNKALELEPDHIEARKRLGESYYRLHNFMHAFEQFKKILTDYPNDPEANFMIGITIYKRAALDEYIDEFLELYGLLNKTEIEKNKKKNDAKKQRIYDEMIRCFYTAQLARNNFYEAAFNLALTYQEMGQLDSAYQYYTKTLQINPYLAKARIVLAKFYENQENYDQALEEYKWAARIDPVYFLDYPKLGKEYDEVDVLNLVKNELEQEIRLDPGNISSSLSLANILYAQGYKGQAALLYRKVLALQPGEKTAKKMLARMEN